MDSPQSPRPMDAQVEPPEDVPRAMSAHSYYRVRSESTLEELQNQLDEQAMAGGGSASERLDRIVPEPESPATMPKTGTGGTGAGSLQSLELGDVIEHRPSMRDLHSAVDNVVLGQLGSVVAQWYPLPFLVLGSLVE